LHAYLAPRITAALDASEILRAEWVARVAALDLYIHELVAQEMLSTFEGKRPPSAAYQRFQVSNEFASKLRVATPVMASAAFDLEVRERLSLLTFQAPDKIAEGVRLFSDVELWNSVAVALGATATTASNEAKALKKRLSLIVNRRNKIAHEGDLQLLPPREPWPIAAADVMVVADTVNSIVHAIDSVVY
jgi:hypothetical protein